MPPDADRRATISVVVPVKDDAASLERCLRALAAQTRRPDEVLVVDNGSTDDSAAVAGRAGATVIRCSEPGIPAASALGYDSAVMDLILRLDADCIPPDSWVQSVVTAFAERPDVAAFTGGARFVDGPRWLRVPLAAVYLAAYATASAPALGHLPLFGSNLAMRRGIWHDVRASVHRHDAEVHDDLDLAFHVGEAHRIRYLRGVPMGMSMRPFRSTGSMMQRVARGFRTIAVHWPHDFPPARWLRLAMTRTASTSRALPRADADAAATST